MSNLSPEVLFWLILAAGAVVTGTIAAILLRRGTVVGPLRTAPGESPAPLLGITVFGIAVWMLLPALYATSLQVRDEGARDPTTEPATRPAALQFTPQQSVLVSMTAGLIVTAVLVGGNMLVRPGGLARMGLAPGMLPRGVLLGLAASMLVIPMTMLVAAVTERVWRLIELDHPGAHEMLQILQRADDPMLRVMIFVSAIVVAPIFEELLFRGHIQTLMLEFGRRLFAAPMPLAAAPDPSNDPVEPLARWLAILVASVLFTLIHGAVWMMPPIFFLSLCMGYVYERTGNLFVPMTVHLAFNTLNVVVFVNFAAR